MAELAVENDEVPPLTTSGLSHRFRQGQPLFHDLNLTFAPGSLTALTGSSGSGKSTLLFLLGFLLTPREGEVRFGELSSLRAGDSERSSARSMSFGFVFQDAALDPSRPTRASVIEPARYAGIPIDVANNRAKRLLARFGVSEQYNSRPGQISGGQAQRIALARALVCEPKVILADEPTGNLDSENTILVYDALRAEAHRGRIVIVATHDRDIAKSADAEITL